MPVGVSGQRPRLCGATPQTIGLVVPIHGALEGLEEGPSADHEALNEQKRSKMARTQDLRERTESLVEDRMW